MKPKRIILVRHLESEANVDFSIYSQKPDYRVELSANGHKQALEVGQKIASIIGEGTSVQFYISPYSRAKQTLECVLERLQKIRYRVSEEPRRREQEAGMLQTAEERIEFQNQYEGYGRFFFRFPQGESAADVYDRVSCFLGSLWRHFERPDYAENVVIISHGRTLRVFLMRWFHLEYPAFEGLDRFHNGIVITLVLNRKTDRYELAEEECRAICLDPAALVGQDGWQVID